MGFRGLLLLVMIAAGCPSPGARQQDTGEDLATARRDLSIATDASEVDAARAEDLAQAKNSGDCDDDTQCAPGKCVAVAPGGFRTCAARVEQATMCHAGRPDQCCNTGDCDEGRCLESPVVLHCVGIMPLVRNVCATDRCKNDGECPGGQICAPAGIFGNKVRTCVVARCRLDAECRAEPGGICAPVRSPCCSAIEGLFCVYPGGCRDRGMCGDGEYCAVEGDRGVCKRGVPICPG